MSAVRKMILIPLDRYKSLVKKSGPPLSTPDATYTDTSPDVTYAEDDEGEPETDHGLRDEVIVGAMPKNYKNKARALLEHIRSSSDIRWNGKGELINEKGTEGSHITDLIKDLSRPDYDGPAPEGADSFYEALARENIPSCFMNNVHRKKIVLRLRKRGNECRVDRSKKWITY
jgi:hypothetical protein